MSETVQAPTVEEIREKLTEVKDPEIDMNIIELGLVYELALQEHAPPPGVDVLVTMTLTAPGCGMGQVLADDVKARLLELPGVADVKVELTFDPPAPSSPPPPSPPEEDASLPPVAQLAAIMIGRSAVTPHRDRRPRGRFGDRT